MEFVLFIVFWLGDGRFHEVALRDFATYKECKTYQKEIWKNHDGDAYFGLRCREKQALTIG